MRALLIAVLALLVGSAPASAQPTMAVWVDQGGQLTGDYDVPLNTPFSVVVTLDSAGEDLIYTEWSITDLASTVGLIEFGAVFPHGSCGLIPENCMDGEYRISMYGCVPPGERIELARILFADFGGLVFADEVVSLLPMPGASLPESPGFVDCEGFEFGAPMGGTPGGTTSSGVVVPPGALVLNPTRPIPNDADSFGVLKTRF